MKTSLQRATLIVLFLYGALFSFALTLGAVSRGFTFANSITTLLFLPVAYHFAAEIHRIYKEKTTIRNENHEPVYAFSFRSFVTQKDPLFAVTLILFALSLSLTVLKATSIIPQTQEATEQTTQQGAV